ncbi:MAG: sarcosine oxidase subunit gamma [Steroidobacteraceae bacterium]
MAELAATRVAPHWNEGAWLHTMPPAARFILRGDADVRATAGQVWGVNPSEQPCRARANGGRAALWLGPDEQLLLGAASEAESLARQLTGVFAGRPHSLVDVSHRQLALEVSGRHASALLSVGCPLDLDLAQFPTGMCTRTLFAKAEIVLWRTGDNRFQLEVWRSFADYVARTFIEASRDFAQD